MRRAILKQPLVIAGWALAPRERCVVGGLLRQQRQVVIKFDKPLVVVTHMGRVMAEDDIVWRRPDAIGDRPHYAGPPVSGPPPPDWRPTMLEPVTAPRALPAIDHDEIDRAEHAAARITHTIGLVAIFVLIILACSRF